MSLVIQLTTLEDAEGLKNPDPVMLVNLSSIVKSDGIINLRKQFCSKGTESDNTKLMEV